MSIKQDRTGTRTSEDLRRRLNVGDITEAADKVDASVEQIEKLSNQVSGLNNSITDTRKNYVSTVGQSFTKEQKEIARQNIGAGTSSFSGSYNDLNDRPTKLSKFINDVGYITGYSEHDPTVPTHVKNITESDIAKWNSGTGGGGGVSGDTLPIGSMIPYGSATPPTNWLVCDGRAVSRTTYAELFKVIGISYGAGDGSTTFNLPNKKGKVSVGLDANDTDFNTIGKTGGEKEHTLTIDEMPSHSHGINTRYNADEGAYNVRGANSTGTETNGAVQTSGVGGSQPHNNLQPYQVDNWIIKAFQSSGVVAEVSNTKSDSTTDTYSCDYINKLNVYSTTETKIGMWLGKTLYRKVVEFTISETINTFNYVEHDIQNIDECVEHKMKFINSGIQYEACNDIILETRFDATYFSYYNNNQYITNSSAYVILEYTKTTD